MYDLLHALAFEIFHCAKSALTILSSLPPAVPTQYPTKANENRRRCALLCAVASSPTLRSSTAASSQSRPWPKALFEAGLDEHSVETACAALKTVFDLRHARPGDQLRVISSDGAIDPARLSPRLAHEWNCAARRPADREQARGRGREPVELIELSIETRCGTRPRPPAKTRAWRSSSQTSSRGTSTSTRRAEGRPRALHHREERGPQRPRVGYGEVLPRVPTDRPPAEAHVSLRISAGDKSYFLEDGASARKTFLKSPLKFANVTSPFGMRFHPILNYVGAHNGVDYGTPVGTPVWAVADGTVVRAVGTTAAGNMICLRHVNSLETCYLHLSKFGEGENAITLLLRDLRADSRPRRTSRGAGKQVSSEFTWRRQIMLPPPLSQPARTTVPSATAHPECRPGVP